MSFATLYGLPVYDEPNMERIVVVTDPETGERGIIGPVEELRRVFFLAEIREIVRDGILAAHPWIRDV